MNIVREENQYLNLFKEIDKRLVNGRVILCVEGGSASGKSTLSEILSNQYDCTIFHMDDFFLPLEKRNKERFMQVGGNIDWERFLKEIVEPLKHNSKIVYRKFDCSSMSLGDEIEITPKKLIVIEGVYSMHLEFGKYYDFSVFLNISKELQKERILKRNSSTFAKRFFEEWIPLENEYFKNTNILKRCDMIIE